MYVDRMDDSQIANFPYIINEHTLIRKTQAQTYQLDLDSDADNDYKSDAIVWFTLSAMTNDTVTAFSDARKLDDAASGNIYSATPGDGINNYYIYNNGNVTFTGLGANKSYTNGEVQLFVNTLLAAYEAGFINPTVTYYKTDDVSDGELDSIAVAYDANITYADDKIDSSIQYDESKRDYLYKFVNPNTNKASGVAAQGTKAYFKVNEIGRAHV